MRARNQTTGTATGTNGSNSNTGSNGEKSALQNTTVSEPTEVILYGYGADVQYAAIEFFERVSGGHIYEDYDRFPPSSRYSLNLSRSQASFTAPFSRSTSGVASSFTAMTSATARSNSNYFSRSNSGSNSNAALSDSALRKKNAYVGGSHWIKVTFDSARAADAACRCAPHVICGYLVYTQPYRGAGPGSDAAILAPANTNLINASASPGRSSDDATTTLSQQTLQQEISPGSSTATSATATEGNASRQSQVNNPQPSLIRHNTSSTPTSNTMTGTSALSYPSLGTPGRSSTSTSPFPFDPFASNHVYKNNANSNTLPTPQTPSQAQSRHQTQLATPLRVQGAKRAVLLPADEALLPVIPRWQRLLSQIPIVNLFLDHSQHYDALNINKLHDVHGKEMILGAAATSGIGGLGGAAMGAATGAASVLGAGAVGAVGAVGVAGVLAAAGPGTGSIIGTQVPRRESDGAFDWDNAGLYWRCWASVDHLFGTDFCGISGDE